MEAKTRLPATNEIVSVIWAKKCLEDGNFLTEMKADPATKAFAGKTPSMQVHAVQNTADTLNICVPDYGVLNDGTVDRISDEQMAGISGGIFWFIPFLVLGAVGAGVTAAAGVGIAASAGAEI